MQQQRLINNSSQPNMFRAIILPIFRITRLCTTACMLPAGGRPAASSVHYTTSCNTQSSAPEDGKNNCLKHVELTGIINKPLLLHLVGCLYYLYQWWTVKQISDNEIYLLINYIKIVLWRVAKRLSYIEDAQCLKVKLFVLHCCHVTRITLLCQLFNMFWHCHWSCRNLAMNAGPRNKFLLYRWQFVKWSWTNMLCWLFEDNCITY